MRPRIWLIAGPTASGKSALALRLAETIGAEIIGADSMQLYAGLPVITAAPSPEEMARVPHHLVGVADPADAWSTGRWLRAAVEVIEKGRPCVIVGGTGLYFNALTRGLAEVPDIPAAARAAAQADFDTMGETAFRARLAAHDPAAAGRIAPADRQRLTRAWEVYAHSGRALSDWQADGTPALGPGAWRGVTLDPPRDVLYRRCDRRLEAMVREGALEEVRALAARKLPASLPAMKAVGVREFAAHLAGEMTLEAALEAAQRETRRYAKRQTTWMRGQMADWPRLDAEDAEGQWRQIIALKPSLTA